MALIDNLISYYKFDESSGNLIDSQGSNDLVNNGGSYSAVGIINTGIDFEVTENDSVNIPTALPNALSNTNFTINWWQRQETTSTGTSAGAMIDMNGTERILIRWANGTLGAFGPVVLTVTQSFNADQYYMMTYTVDSSGAELFVDGVSVGTQAGDATINFGASAASHIAADFIVSSNRGHDGELDEWGFWDRKLTDPEITSLYNSGAGLAYPFSAATIRKIKIAGTFVEKPILTKVAGTFVDKPIKIKVGGTFQDA